MSKQSSVEELFQKLWDTPKDKLTWYVALKEAKAMHKEEVENAYNVGSPYKTAEQYYNETFGGNNEP